MSPPQRRPPVPPDLMEEILGEILLRIPPEEPAHLVRFALVCKPWLRVLSDPAFRRGYRERHRRPPLLGFVHNLYENGAIPRFVPTTASRCSSPVFNCQNWWALDSRHGRVLVHRMDATRSHSTSESSPARNKSFPSELIGFAESTYTIFLETEAGVFTLEIKSEDKEVR
ncbi:uncharacterized protein [Setaria viridis]|uniref:uncharacterized protein n=1 Tax=Setaria viridis TaxID=4556 RepID=UPI001493C2CA|nr:uncharacterized protein LOC117846144 isoform X2 [Setaria viridis]